MENHQAVVHSRGFHASTASKDSPFQLSYESFGADFSVKHFTEQADLDILIQQIRV
jgi:hypothetical protein